MFSCSVGIFEPTTRAVGSRVRQAVGDRLVEESKGDVNRERHGLQLQGTNVIISTRTRAAVESIPGLAGAQPLTHIEALTRTRRTARTSRGERQRVHSIRNIAGIQSIQEQSDAHRKK